MPKILDRLVKQLRAKGHSKSAAFAIATKSLQRSGNLKKGTKKATAKGRRRGGLTPAQRAKSRASKKSGRPARNYRYNKRTNTATLKRRRRSTKKRK